VIRSLHRIRSALARWPALLLTAALAVTGVVALPAAPASAASDVQVFVGYADNLRANPANFPTPWDGSPSVAFAGCHPNCTFDAGAVRLVNNTSIAVTVDSVVVKVSTCVFDIWPHGTVLQPNQNGICTGLMALSSMPVSSLAMGAVLTEPISTPLL